MYVFTPENLHRRAARRCGSPAACCGASAARQRVRADRLARVGGRRRVVAVHFALPQLLDIPTLAVSDYKGVAYARKFPDAESVYERASPFGYLEVYSSSYLHFAPGLSDNAAFNLPTMPANAYLGLYIDGDGPSGIMRDLPAKETAYFHYLPMIYPYLIKEAPDTFVVQFGGGISTAVALQSDSKSVTVAEGNPRRARGLPHRPGPARLHRRHPQRSKVRVIDYEGRLFLAHTDERFDVIDLSLADSVGLSNPGGFAIVEKFSYTREAMASYMRALKDGGVLSVTLWNKEEPPKSVLKLYATMAAAAREVDAGDIADRFFVASSYLSTATVLYKRGGFTPEEIDKLRDAHARHVVRRDLLSWLRLRLLANRQRARRTTRADLRRRRGRPASRQAGGRRRTATPPATSAPHERRSRYPPTGKAMTAFPATTMGRLAWHHLVHWRLGRDRATAMSSTRARSPTTRPYFAAYVKPGDLPRVLDRLELLQDEWGYLLIWATLGIACLPALSLVAHTADLRLAHRLQSQSRASPHHRLFRLPWRGLHHGRGGPDIRFHPGA